MADIIDVGNALRDLITQALYPSGTAQPSAANGLACKAYVGWPVPAQLDADLKASKQHVSVYPTPTERNTTRYPRAWKPLSITPATLTLTVSGQQVTVGGAMPSPFTAHNLAVLIGSKNYTYAVQSSDTLASIATALAALIVADYPGTSSAGAVITLPVSAYVNVCKVGTTGTSIRELRRQERVFQITIWSDTPGNRDKVSGLVDVALAGVQFIALADGTAARLIYKGSPMTDQSQKVALYRRDLLYTVEYATTQTSIDTQIVAVQSNISNKPTGTSVPISSFTINQ